LHRLVRGELPNTWFMQRVTRLLNLALDGFRGLRNGAKIEHDKMYLSHRCEVRRVNGGHVPP